LQPLTTNKEIKDTIPFKPNEIFNKTVKNSINKLMKNNTNQDQNQNQKNNNSNSNNNNSQYHNNSNNSKTNSSKVITDERQWINSENIFCAQFEIGEIQSLTYISLHQPSTRLLLESEKQNSDLRAPLGFLLIAKYEDDKYTFICSEMINWEKLTIEQTFEKGIYHIFAKSYWKFNTKYSLVISSYSDYINDIIELKYEEIPADWLTQILADMGCRTENRLYPSRDEPCSFASNIMFDNNNFSGFCLFYYENTSKNGDMCINLSFKNLKGFKILNLPQILSLNGSEFKNFNGKISDIDYGNCNLVFKIPKNSSMVVILQVLIVPWLCSINWYQDIWFEYSVEVMLAKMRRKENTDIIELDTDLKLYEMEHDRGVIILIENLASANYKIFFEATSLKNLELKENEDVLVTDVNKRNLEFIVKSKGIVILNYGIQRSVKEFPYKLRYIYTIEKME